MHYQGEEVHKVFRLDDKGNQLVLVSQDGGDWYIKVCPVHGALTGAQNFTEALREAGMRLSRAGDDEAIAASLEPALRYLVHQLGPGERFGDIGGPLLALYHQLTGRHFSG